MQEESFQLFPEKVKVCSEKRSNILNFSVFAFLGRVIPYILTGTDLKLSKEETIRLNANLVESNSQAGTR